MKPYWPDETLKRHVLPAAKRAGITKKIGWHSFRRTLATLLQSSGASVKTTQTLFTIDDVGYLCEGGHGRQAERARSHCRSLCESRPYQLRHGEPRRLPHSVPCLPRVAWPVTLDH